MRPWLIQLGKFKETAKTDIDGINSALRFEYMASADFRFGALKMSLQRIIDYSQNYAMYEIISVKAYTGESLFLYCSRTRVAEARECAITLSKNKNGFKQPCDMVDYVTGERIKSSFRGEFWWDIENDYMIVFGTERAKKIMRALAKTKEDWSKRHLL